jgi:hypothetical protein
MNSEVVNSESRSKRKVINRSLSIVENFFATPKSPAKSANPVRKKTKSNKRQITPETSESDSDSSELSESEPEPESNNNLLHDVVVVQRAQYLELLTEKGVEKEKKKVSAKNGTENKAEITDIAELEANSKYYSELLARKPAKKIIKRKDLKLKEKIMAIKMLQRGEKTVKVAEELQCGETQIKKLKKLDIQKKLIAAAGADADPEQSRTKQSVLPSIESALIRWIRAARAAPVPIPLCDSVVQMKAIDFKNEISIALGRTQMKFSHEIKFKKQLDEFKFSSGWVTRFKQRHNLSFKILHGESGDVDMEVVEASRTSFNTLLTPYKLCDIYNCDETALFYKLLPNQTLGAKNKKEGGHKRSKERVTALLCCNADGTDKRRPLIIGKSENPRPLAKKNRANLPCVYAHQRKAWMDSTIFFEYLFELNSEMQKAKRNIILIIDGAACHGSKWDFEENNSGLTNVKITFLPPNCTSVMQPLDQGIIRSTKAHYRKRLVRTFIHAFDRKLPSPVITIYDAIHFLGSSWSQSVTAETIRNCWRKSGLLPPEKAIVLKANEEADSAVHVADTVSVQQELTIHLNRTEFEHDEETKCANFIDCDANEPIEASGFSVQEEVLTILNQEKIGRPENLETETDSLEIEPEFPKLVSSKEFLTAAETMLLYLESHCEDKSEILTVLRSEVEREEKFHLKQLTQSTITSYFVSRTQQVNPNIAFVTLE